MFKTFTTSAIHNLAVISVFNPAELGTFKFVLVTSVDVKSLLVATVARGEGVKIKMYFHV